MQLQVKGKNVEVSESIRDYAETKLRKLELTVEKTPSIAASHVAEATIWTKGPTLRARESAPDVRASIDLLVDKLERQVTRYREKRQRHGHHTRSNGHAEPAEGSPVVPGEAS